MRRFHGCRGRFAFLAVVAALSCWQGRSAHSVPIEIGEADLVVQHVRGAFDGTRRIISVRDNVHSQEVIETGPGSATRLEFLDSTELSIGADSRVTLDRFVYDPDRNTGSILAGLLSGVFRFVSGAMPSSSYEIRMPSATLAIRGTSLGFDIEAGVLLVESGAAEVRIEARGVFLVRQGQCMLFRPEDGGPRVVDASACEHKLGRYRAMLAMLEEEEIRQALNRCDGLLGWAQQWDEDGEPGDDDQAEAEGVDGEGPTGPGTGRSGGTEAKQADGGATPPAGDGDERQKQGGTLADEGVLDDPVEPVVFTECGRLWPVFAAAGGGGGAGFDGGPVGFGPEGPVAADEPPTAWLALAGLFGLWLARRRRPRQPAARRG